jgi:hypothetical protein
LFELTQQIRCTDRMLKDKVSLNLNWTRNDLHVSVTATHHGEVA